MKYVVAGTAGHIDHGKSALVMALTGTDPDRLEEEKRRGITIDLGFARLDLGGGLTLAFIDVPGHERFVKNMLAGATGTDLVLLVIAADESIKPQTREHFEICKLLGIRQGLVALTKADLVDEEIRGLVRLEIQELVAGSFLDGAPVVAVSARTGEGLPELKNELRRLAQATASKPAGAPVRLPIDRAFVMKGFGTVVTGTLIAGKIEKEQELELFPLGRRVRVRGIEAHNQAAEFAAAGQRTALNLSGIEVKDIQRGMMLAPPGEFEAASRLDCSLRLLPSARPLKNRARVHFHCWAGECIAEVLLLEGKALEPGGCAYAQLRLAQPGLFLPGDRFIIRQFSPVITIGGGEVIDNLPSRHRASDPEAWRFLAALEKSDAESRLELLLEAAGEASIKSLVARTGWASEDVARVAASLAKNGKLRLLGEPPSLAIHASAFRSLLHSVLQALEAFHARDPLLGGIGREDLRGQARITVGGAELQPSAPAFHAALQALSAAKKIRAEREMVALAGRGAHLSSEELAAKEQISRAFEQAGLRVPAPAEVFRSLRIDGERASRILQILLREKVLHRVADGLIFHQSALKELRRLMEARKAVSTRIDVPAFKKLTGASRKYAIPLLEYLDRERVTRRAGDERIIL